MASSNNIIQSEHLAGEPSDHPIMIEVNDVSMTFNMASEQLNNLKEYMVSLVKGELRFKEFRALDHISLTVEKGDVFGILGTNGSGKSTLMKIIAGVLEPSKGSVAVNGNIAPLIELGAGFDMDLTARENIYLNGALLGYSRKLIDDHFDEIVDFAEVREFLDIPIKNYSSGMIARIAFSIATVIVPDILLVDEVLSVGDFMFQRKCENRIRSLIDEYGVTVLIVSHSNDQIERLCSKAIWIEKGDMQISGNAQDVCMTYTGLGGRKGSESAKENIIRYFKAYDGHDGSYEVYEGNPFDVTTSLARSAFSKKGAIPETVIFSCTATHINSIFANSIAKHFNAVVLPVTVNDIPPEILQYLYEVQPKKAIYIDCGKAGAEVIPKITALPFIEELIDLSDKEGNVVKYSESMLAFGIESDAWKYNSLLLLDFDQLFEGLLLIPILYKDGLPAIISRRSAGERDITRSVNLAMHNGISEALLVGNICDDDETVELCQSLDCRKVANDDDPRENKDIIASLYNRTLDSNIKHRLCITCSSTISQGMGLISIGEYLDAHNAFFYSMDETSLDSVSDCLDFIHENRGRIESITVIGSNNECPLLQQHAILAALYSERIEGPLSNSTS